MQLVYRALKADELPTASSMLARYMTEDFRDLRGFEWGWLHQLCDGQSRTVMQPGDGGKRITRVAVSPGGSRAAAVPSDGREILILDPATGRLVNRITPPDTVVGSMTFDA